MMRKWTLFACFSLPLISLFAQPVEIEYEGGAGLLIKSSNFFSAIDVDAANGDAGIRFLDNGTHTWLINTFGGDLNFAEFGFPDRMEIETGTGNVSILGMLSKGGGSFKIDHPLDPSNKYLYHSFVESPDMMNIYNGNVTTDNNGIVEVELPLYFEALNIDFRYQLTVIGSFAQAIIKREVENNVFIIATNKPNTKVSWQVTGVRNDPFANKNRIAVEVEKEHGDRGKYLHPQSYGKSIEMGEGNHFTTEGRSEEGRAESVKTTSSSYRKSN